MAEENLIQTNIVANANFAPLITDLNKVTLALTGLQEKLNASNKALATQAAVMNKAFSETLRSTGQFSTHFVSLSSDVDKFGQQLDRGQMKLGQFFRVYRDHLSNSGGIIRQLAQQQVQMQNAILQPLGRNAEGLMQYNVHIPRGLDLIKNRTKIASQELAIMNKVVQEGANQLINWGKNTQWAGRQLTVGLTVPMAAFGKAAADAFRQADEQLVRLTKVYGGLSQTSATELAKVRKDVTETAGLLAKQYGASFKDTLGLAADIAATGKQGNELLGSIQETTRLSVLGEVDRQEAMKATLAIQTAFKQNTQELSESINFLNAVENQTSTTLQDLVEAIPKAGPVVKGLGGDVKDLALYLTAMREGGISASEGANALKSGLASLINPTKVATGMFAGFGIDLKGIVAKNAGDVTQTILDLQTALDQLDPLQKQQALEQLFGKFQFARMNALFSNLGKQGSQTLQVLDLMKASSQDLANVAGRELAQVTESASGRYRRAVEGLRADLAGVGDQFLNIATHIIGVIDKIINFADKLPGPVKQVLSIMGMITAGLGPIIMLTGVLGNFFGYIIKGVYHFKALFKGAEGWKLLTPEILAANKAGDLAEQTFYSDAKAAAILNQSLQALIASYNALQTKVNTGIIPTATVQAAAMSGLGRQVNPASKYISDIDTRQMSHLNPVSAMTEQEKLAQTMFGVVPGASKVNQSIGAAPQMYMLGDIEKVQGASAMKGVSTGIVGEEAAKWHSMTAALGMQSKAELARLKRDILATGTITAELSQAYEAMLPKMNDIIGNAAKASESIVQNLKINKINAQQARAEIIALNAQTEALMAQAAQDVAAGLGRNINVTQVPMLNQPVIDPKTGKSNMKELLKKGRTRNLTNAIARALGVKTYGASYSMETTIPKRMEKGGPIGGRYNPSQHGARVPGPNVNYDIIDSDVPQGGFVLNKPASEANPDLVALATQNYNKGGQTTRALLTPGETVVDPITYSMYKEAYDNANGMALGGMIRSSKNNYGIRLPRLTSGSITGTAQLMHQLFGVAPRRGYYGSTGIYSGPRGGKILSISAKPATTIMGAELPNMPINPATGQPHTLKSLNKLLAHKGLVGKDLDAWMAAVGYYSQGGPMVGSTTNFLNGIGSRIDSKTKNKILSEIDKKFFDEILRFKRTGTPLTDSNNPYHRISKEVIQREIGSDPYLMDLWGQWKTKTSSLNPLYLADYLQGRGHSSSAGIINTKIIDPTTNQVIRIGKLQGSASDKSMAFHGVNEDWQSYYGFNSGGQIPGYSLGGVLSKAGIFKRMKAMYSLNEGGRGYSINALPMKPNTYMFRNLPISYRAKKYLYDALVHNVANRSGKTWGDVPTGTWTQFGRMTKRVRGFGHADQYDIWQDVARQLKDNPNLSPKDKAFFDRIGYAQQTMPYDVGKGVLGLNRGGKIPGYALGGGIPGFIGSMLMSTLGYAGGSKLGGMLGGDTGSMIGGFLGGSLGSVGAFRRTPDISASYEKSIFANKQFGQSLAGTAMMGNKVTSSLSRLMLGITKFNLVAAGVTTVLVAGYGMWKKYQEQMDRVHKSFGLTAETAGKLGLKFKDYNSEIKSTLTTLKAIQERGRLAYESMASSGTPLNLTIEQYKKLRVEVKKTMSDQIDMINNTKKQDLGQLAVQLKQQFVNAGVSAEEASKKIYTAFQLSNKAIYAGGATFGNAGFSSITNAKTSATSSIETFGLATRKGDAISQANALNNALTGVDAAIKEIQDDYKKANKNAKEALPEYEAQAKLQDLINSKVKDQRTLTQGLIDEMAKQNPEIRKFANTQDTVLSLWQKMRLAASGYSTDLSKISAAQANALYTMQQTFKTAFESQNKTGSLKTQYSLLEKYKNAMDNTAKAAKGLSIQQQQNSKDRIDQLRKEIELINKSAEDRKKALQEEQQDQDVLVEIQKAKIEYQNALASGDMATAAQAQLEIQKLVSQQQTTLAERAIESKRAADVAPKEAEIERLQKSLDKAATAAAKASESLSGITDKYNSLKTKIDDVNTAMANYKTVLETGNGSLTNASNQLIAAAKALNITVPTTASTAPDMVGGKPVFRDRTLSSKELGSSYFEALGGGQLSLSVDAKTVIINAEKILSKGSSSTNPIQLGSAASLSPKFKNESLSGWTSTWGISSTRETVKRIAQEKGIAAGQYFSIEDKNGGTYVFRVEKDKNITMIKKPEGKAAGGYIRGKGTTTSDSIPIMASDKEYMFSAAAVKGMGGPANVDYLHNAAKAGKGNILIDLLNKKGSKNYESELKSLNLALEYLTKKTGVNFQIAGANAPKSAIPIKFYDRGFQQEGRGASTAGYWDEHMIRIGNVNSLNKLSFNRKGSRDTIVHELIHALSTTKYKENVGWMGSAPHSKNPFNAMFPEMIPFLPRFISKDDIAGIQNASKYFAGKMHTWNGQVPGPYGQEVGAILKAGTEGVYQNDYIKSLQNQGNVTYNIAPVINPSPGMDAKELAVLAAKETLNMFKDMQKVEMSKSGKPRFFAT